MLGLVEVYLLILSMSGSLYFYVNANWFRYSNMAICSPQLTIYYEYDSLCSEAMSSILYSWCFYMILISAYPRGTSFKKPPRLSDRSFIHHRNIQFSTQASFFSWISLSHSIYFSQLLANIIDYVECNTPAIACPMVSHTQSSSLQLLVERTRQASRATE